MTDHVTEIDIETLAAALADGSASVIDVREHDQYAEGHVPGAATMPLDEVTTRLDELDRDRPVHVVCGSGVRSKVAAELLTAAGFEATSVAGGTADWSRSGRPLA